MPPLKGFADLKLLRKTLKEQEEARAVADALRARSAEAQRQNANLFRHSVGEVKAMPQPDRLQGTAPRTAITARVKEDEIQAVLRESLSDLFEVDALMEEDPALSYTSKGLGPDVVRKMRKGCWPVQDELDLHGLRRDDARDGLGAFLRHASARHYRCVRVIHGKGLGSKGQAPVLKSMVHSWLVQKEEVIAFCAARPSDGGDGALIVLLKAALQTQR
jgi:DNA-nicking Smr family endonuclease